MRSGIRAIIPAISIAASFFAIQACAALLGPEKAAGEEKPKVAVGLDPGVLPDGWARAAGAAGLPAAPGGYGAAGANVYSVSTRSEFVAALRCGGASASDLPKIIYVQGMIDLCANSANLPQGGGDFIAASSYGATYASYQAYIDAYAASCAIGSASSLGDIQTALAKAQKAAMLIPIGSNTSIIGVGADSGFKNGSLSIDKETNVVIRNLSILDSYDYFPAWDEGENLINSAYDNVHLSGASFVWVDHCALGDGDRPDSGLPNVSISGLDNKKWVTHDGLLDVTNAANYVTVSWNRFEVHDKTMLFGSSDSADAADTGKIKATVHHNFFSGVNQRLPRVRFGQVHVYNNYYADIGSYAIGVGDHARIYSEANCFGPGGPAFADYDHVGHEGSFYDAGSVGARVQAGMAMATAAALGWKPSDFYSYSPQGAGDARASVLSGAGPGKLQ